MCTLENQVWVYSTQTVLFPAFALSLWPCCVWSFPCVPTTGLPPAPSSCVLTQSMFLDVFLFCNHIVSSLMSGSLAWYMRIAYNKDGITQKRLKAKMPFYLKKKNLKVQVNWILLSVGHPCSHLRKENHFVLILVFYIFYSDLLIRHLSCYWVL